MRFARTAVAGTTMLLALSACGTTESSPQATPVALVGSWGDAGGSADVGSMRHLPIGSGWGPTRAEIRDARRKVAAMTLAERAGQVLVASYSGTAAPTDVVERLHLGGVVVFSANYQSTDQIRASNQALQGANGRDWPVLVGVDQEGGLVERITGGTRFPTFMTAGAADDTHLTRAAATGSGGELAGLGFNVDFAPDADVTAGNADPVIGTRSAGSDAHLVGRHTVASARGFRASGVVPVLKHFPGHGSLTTDSHIGLPVQNDSLKRLMKHDLVPFSAGIGAGLPMVMVGHIDVRKVDPGNPASLSRKVVTGLLRDRLGFEGVAVTDSMQMQPVRSRYAAGPAAVHALRAGEDVLLMPAFPAAARDGIVRAVRDGRLAQARLDQAATRMVALLLHQQAQGTDPLDPGAASGASAALSKAGITSVAGPCEGRIVGRRVRLLGEPEVTARFRAAAAGSGIRYGRKGTRVALVGYQDPVPRKPGVLVATDRPYLLGSTRAPVAKIATYGETPGAMAALVDVLLGNAPAPGHLPVPVPGVARSGC